MYFLGLTNDLLVMEPRFPKEREERKKEGRKREKWRERERRKEGEKVGARKKRERKCLFPRTECSFQESVKFLCSHLSFRAWDFMLQPRSDPGKSMETRDS